MHPTIRPIDGNPFYSAAPHTPRRCFTIALATRVTAARGALHIMPIPFLFAVAIVIFYLISSINILKEYERAVIFRLGRVKEPAAGPGVVFIFRPVYQIVRVSLRQEAMEVPAQDVITRDNVTLKVNAVITLRVIDPTKAVIEVANYIYQTSQFAQTTLRSVLGEVDLDGLLAHREQLNQRIQTIIDGRTSPYGVKVVSVEVKQVDMPESMLRAMAKQAEAERERRSKIIHAEGEFNAAAKLVEAAALMATQPMTLQLRYLQTLTEIGVEKNTTIVFPLPMELMNLLNKSFVPFVPTVEAPRKD
jgi:regulator of protease activity HflC (stomatin/prohibitin superfamily)